MPRPCPGASTISRRRFKKSAPSSNIAPTIPRNDPAAYETGAEALADLHKQCPSLLLLDISLPGLDGYAVLKAIRADTKFSRLPVVALTAHAMAGDRDRILAAGFDDYVAKPIDDESILLSCITRLLKQ
jgi:CheY-like chemotaxis protein